MRLVIFHIFADYEGWCYNMCSNAGSVIGYYKLKQPKIGF